VDLNGDGSRLKDLLRQREDRQALNERLLEPGQSWSLWAGALASLLPPLQVADFGCGTGVLSVSVARWAKKVTAIDRSGSALASARARAKREGLSNIAFLQEDLCELSLPPGQLDLVVLSQSLHHVDAPSRVLAEAARVLKRGGRVVALELLPHEEAWVTEQLGHKHLGIPPEEVEAWMREHGFGKLTREVHARAASSPFRVYRLTGVKR
jgi:ArsR family transcriptional regulator